MAASKFSGADRALALLRRLPRIAFDNIRDNPEEPNPKQRGHGQYGGKQHGCGQKGSGQRQNYMRLGYETGNNPFYLRFGYEPYYEGHHLRREYPPLSLLHLQKLIDTGRLDASQPIDLSALCNTKVCFVEPLKRQFGFQLTDEGMDQFEAKVNLEVQWATERVIAAVERCGGTITTAYYDIPCLLAAVDPEKFFRRGLPIPKRQLPPPDAVEFYTDAKNRGYLSDPEKVAEDRLVLSQKYGYKFPNLEAEDPKTKAMLLERKDPRQLFYGLHPGWVVNLKDKTIMKPTDEELLKYYQT